jgi:hypothetical protein
MRRRRIRFLVISTVLLVSGAVSIWIAYRAAVQQERRNRSLIVALRSYDTRSVVALLKEGADPNARDHTGDVSIWDFIFAKLSGKPVRFSTGPTALDLVFNSAILLDRPDLLLQSDQSL